MWTSGDCTGLRNRRKLLGTVALFGMVSLTASCGDSAGGGDEPSGLVWGTSSVGSSYYNVAVAMSEEVTRSGGPATSVQSVGGSTATLHAIADGKADLGMSNTLAALEAVNGEGSFDAPVELRLIAQGDKTLRQLIVRDDSGIETPADLAGKRIVGERPPLPEVAKVTDALLEVYGVDPGSVDVVATTETDEALDALKQGAVDGVVVPGSAGAANFKELAHTTDIRFIDLSERMDELLELLGPAFSAGTIPADSYKGQSGEITTPGLVSLLVAGSDVPDEQVQSVATATFDGNDSITRAVSSASDWTAENTLSRRALLPFHPGAIAYFDDAGLWGDSMQEAQDELLAK